MRIKYTCLYFLFWEDSWFLFWYHLFLISKPFAKYSCFLHKNYLIMPLLQSKANHHQKKIHRGNTFHFCLFSCLENHFFLSVFFNFFLYLSFKLTPTRIYKYFNAWSTYLHRICTHFQEFLLSFCSSVAISLINISFSYQKSFYAFTFEIYSYLSPKDVSILLQ